ncbi:uncharacterized protein LOC133472828 isoform X3 [Phyllopteryx taeniolatus]|uniref:uncharacterized protein LOC133472828 isoform X3 n=1 Tax=Phyllopteryx taeniolatus TaxID=161469 RepID=UPI002AD22BD0|nr:uncharacterized protein LOC133472828 isoform X3 [Phyllopteryx taeniolatus]
MMRRVVVVGALAWGAMLVLLGAFVEAAAGVVHLEQVAYQGEAVTLPSGGDPTRKLASIKWGRLALNASSGDLTIRNVSREDAGDYSVELVDTEKRRVERVLTLVVKRPLQKPSVQTLFSVQSDGGCWVGLRCSSPDLAVNLSWKLEPPLRTAYDMPDPDGGAVVLLTLVALRNGTRFTCTSSRDPENVSDSIRVECKAPRRPYWPTTSCFERTCASRVAGVTASGWRSRGRISLFVLAGIVSGSVLMTVMLKHLQGKEGEEGRGAKEENG